jgi:hypothetical protein
MLRILVLVATCGSLLARPETDAPEPKPTLQPLFYGIAGTTLQSLSLVWKLSSGFFSPWTTLSQAECLLLSKQCDAVAHYFLSQMDNPTTRRPCSSWEQNKQLLSQIGGSSASEQLLLSFLERRWLAKSNGLMMEMVDWLYPSFQASLQIHPETSNTYARNPSMQASTTYQNRVKACKELLPHPKHYPLILTRPCSLQNYLPATVIDVSSLLAADHRPWIEKWKALEPSIHQVCKQRGISPSQAICIETVQQGEIGAIRLLPFVADTDSQSHFLMKWIGGLGLSANRVELDRWPTATLHRATPLAPTPLDKSSFTAVLKAAEERWQPNHPQKTLLFTASLNLLKGLLQATSATKWDEVARCPTRSAITALSFSKIEEELAQLEKEENFFDFTMRLDKIHSHLSALLEIFSPFSLTDFPAIYRELQTSMPPSLRGMTSYTIHTCGMASLAGILKATTTMLGRTPHILYGENTYFECQDVVKFSAKASPIRNASEETLRDVDLIIAQFNPVLKRDDLSLSEYKVEKIEQALHSILPARGGRPLILALDTTLDTINSVRLSKLLREFQDEIEQGLLTVVSYRSGIKFDLFGMDNYCGAPFFMIHSNNPKWTPFKNLLSDPVLVTDKLSINWFCLAYKTAAPQLDDYRKQIFANTRALLAKIPPKLIGNSGTYRILPFEADADPSFIEIKVVGPLHTFRSAALVGGCLTTTCMKTGRPIFNRPSFGFTHPNFTIVFGETNSSLRLTLGLDPADIDTLAPCFETLSSLE